MAIQVDFTFDPGTYRHYMNGQASVLHCHHYMCLTAKLAEDLHDIGGTRILQETAEDSVRPLFDDYFQKHGVADPAERLRVGCEYYSVMGLGRVEMTGSSAGGEARLLRSHVDEGWLKKWGKHDKPVNHVTCGYLAALFAAAFDKPARTYAVMEVESVAVGASEGKFVVRQA